MKIGVPLLIFKIMIYYLSLTIIFASWRYSPATLAFLVFSFIFFFQAEDGIRDIGVTGVQTCALLIYRQPLRQGPGRFDPAPHRRERSLHARGGGTGPQRPGACAHRARRAGGHRRLQDRKSVV